MKYVHFELKTISFEARENIRDKFSSKYSQDDLSKLYSFSLPAFVRWNNRNVFGTVCTNGSSFCVSNFYRLKRDGTPVRLYFDFMTD